MKRGNLPALFIVLLFSGCGFSEDGKLQDLSVELSVNWHLNFIPSDSKLLYEYSNRGGLGGDGLEYSVIQYTEDSWELADLTIQDTYSDTAYDYVVTKSEGMEEECYSEIEDTMDDSMSDFESIPEEYQIAKNEIDYSIVIRSSLTGSEAAVRDRCYIMQDKDEKCIYLVQFFI